MFKKNVLNTFGKTGEKWLADLPDLILACEKRFNIKIEQAFHHQSFNFTANATLADGTDIVLKLCVPTDEVVREVNALKYMQGDAMVKLVDADAEQGILLLEKLTPGEMLANVVDDEAATRIAANIIKKLTKPNNPSALFPKTTQWFTLLDTPPELPSNFPKKIIDSARLIAADLHQQYNTHVLLHGDLHHFNILSATRQPWLAIDPKGVIGPPEYECGALLRNPIPAIASQKKLSSILANRIAILSEILGYDKQIITQWAFAQAVLASVWSLEANSETWYDFLLCAQALQQI